MRNSAYRLVGTLLVGLATGCSPNPPSLPSDTVPNAVPSEAETNGNSQAAATDAPPTRDEELLDYAIAIKDLPLDYARVEQVVHGLAAVECRSRFPEPQFTVHLHVDVKTAAEPDSGMLDLVVWDNEQDQAVAVYDVELAGNPTHAAETADRNLARFRENLRAGRVVGFSRGGMGLDWTPAQFATVVTYGKVGNRGLAEFGFDVELDVTRPEADVVQEKTMAMQKYDAWQRRKEAP